MRNLRRFPVLVLVLIGLALVVIAALILDGEARIAGDSDFYVRMTENPLAPEVPAPWRWRFLTPLLVSLLPLRPPAGFLVLNAFCYIAAGAVFFRYLQLLEFRDSTALLGALWLWVSFPALWPLAHISVDALDLLIVPLCLLLLKKGWFLSFGAALALGGINKQTPLIFVPVFLYLILSERGFRRQTLLKLGAALAAAATLYLAVTELDLIITNNSEWARVNYYERNTSEWSYFSWENIRFTFDYWFLWVEPTPLGVIRTIGWGIAYGLGLTTLFAIGGWRLTPRKWRWSLGIVGVIVAGAVLMNSTIDRVVAISWPFLIPIALLQLERIQASLRRLGPIRVWLVTGVFLAMQASISLMNVPIGGSRWAYRRYWMAAAALCGLIAMLRARRTHSLPATRR